MLEAMGSEFFAMLFPPEEESGVKTSLAIDINDLKAKKTPCKFIISPTKWFRRIQVQSAMKIKIYTNLRFKQTNEIDK
jgi:hypothetical protein